MQNMSLKCLRRLDYPYLFSIHSFIFLRIPLSNRICTRYRQDGSSMEDGLFKTSVYRLRCDNRTGGIMNGDERIVKKLMLLFCNIMYTIPNTLEACFTTGNDSMRCPEIMFFTQLIPKGEHIHV